MKNIAVILSAAKEPVEMRMVFGDILIAPCFDGILHCATLRSE